MIINKEVLKKNKKFILIVIIIIILMIILSMFINKKELIEEKELEDNGKEKFNKLVINEYMSSNKGTLIDENGNSYDWIEIYNGKNKDINLKNYGLSDGNKVKWAFPDIVIKKDSYLIIYLSGKNEEGLHAPFKLSSTGKEQIVLTNSSGKVIDAVDTVPLTKGQSAARNLEGKWIVTNMPSPNYPNTKEGYEQLNKDLEIENNGLRITEVLPKNAGNFMIDGKFYGYIEITNTSQETIDLNGYYISDELSQLYKYEIKDRKLEPNEVFLVYAGSNLNDEENLYTSFGLNSRFGNVYLSNKYGKIIDKVEYSELANGKAMILTNVGYKETTIISPGYINTNEGVAKFQEKYITNKKTLLINEVMSKNNTLLAQNGYNFYDWIELYNNTEEEIDLKEYTITTTQNQIDMYRLPEVKLKPKEYYVIMASGNPQLTNDKYVHTNFKISEVESIYLYKDKKIVDSVMISDIPLNYSYGRGEENGLFYMENPTPLKQNKVGEREVSFAPTFSLIGGIYNNVENVKIKLEGNGDIYYTTDGSIPNNKSKKYEEEIVLTNTTVINAVTYENGKIKSDVITNSYIINENHTVPVLSISISPSNYNKLMRMYSTSGERVDSEGFVNANVKANLEFYEDNGSFSIPCAVSLFGGRARYYSKKSFGIRFKSSYGEGSLNYKLFDNRDTTVYQSIVIRSGSQDQKYAFFRDILGTSLVDDYTNLDVQAYKTAVLYINGKYYGLFNIREKVNNDFIANHYNVDPDKTNLLQGNREVQSGTKNFFNNIINFIRNHNMSLESSYEEIKKLIDIDNFIDYWIAESYLTNNDMINIRYFSHPDIDNGKMKMILFDLDLGWYYYYQNYYNFMTNPDGMTEYNHVSTEILRGLLKNKEFKAKYLERLKYNLENTWKKENIYNKIDYIYFKIYDEMKRNQKRWGLTMQEWENSVDEIKKYVDKRQNYLLQQTKTYFRLTNEEYQKYFGGLV